MRYTVKIKKKISKKLLKLPKSVQKLFFLLVEDLKEDGPKQNSWPNFSPLGKDKFHCHLNERKILQKHYDL